MTLLASTSFQILISKQLPFCFDICYLYCSSSTFRLFLGLFNFIGWTNWETQTVQLSSWSFLRVCFLLPSHQTGFLCFRISTKHMLQTLFAACSPCSNNIRIKLIIWTISSYILWLCCSCRNTMKRTRTTSVPSSIQSLYPSFCRCLESCTTFYDYHSYLCLLLIQLYVKTHQTEPMLSRYELFSFFHSKMPNYIQI